MENRNQSQNEKSDTRVAGAKEELTAEEREYEKKRLEEFEHEAKLAKEQNDSIEQEEETANYVNVLATIDTINIACQYIYWIIHERLKT